MNLNTRIAVASATAVTLVGVLVGCSSSNSSSHSGMSGMPGTSTSPSTSSSVSAKHNAQDVTFAQMMIVHHQGAIQMAQIAASKAAMPDVRQLADKIQKAQSPEIDEMTGWLRAWREPVSMSGPSSMPMPSDSSMGGMDMSEPMASSMPGMTPEDMKSLKAATGMGVDKTFLTLMIEHHKGATQMAQTEISDGQNTQALRLAHSIVESQTKEIQTMQSMLQSMG
ncbi:DUF305 domain-containing protein [Gryllotalpicola kribbensis]